MATHDYVIDNSTGANVRADLNLVLQAILSNNSSSSAPSTTAAYMWWADTTTGILKIRNSANNAWVELLQLDGTLTLEDGSASTPALAFRDDLNTGIFSSAADTFNVATGGVERMELGATTIFNEDGADVDFRIEGDTEANLFYVDAGNDRIGIGTASPVEVLHVQTTSARTNDVEHMLQLTHYSSGTTTTGFGTGIRFQGQRNNGSLQTIGDINFEADVNSGSTISAALVFKPALAGVVTERMRIDSSGQIGMGTSSPVQQAGRGLHINGTDQTRIKLTNTSSGATANDGFDIIQEDGLNIHLINQENAAIKFGTNASERMRILNDGAVCINATARPVVGTEFLGVNGGSASNAVALAGGVTHQSGVALVLSNASNTANQKLIRFAVGSGGDTRGEVTYNGSNMVYGGTSDYRLKKNVEVITDGITKLKNLKPINFNWISEGIDSRTAIGFLAHEVQEVIPEAVSGIKDAVDEEGKNSYQQMEYGRITPLLTAALQEAVAKIEVLETKVAALESS